MFCFTAIASAAEAAGTHVTFIMDNLGAINRARAIIAANKGDTEKMADLVAQSDALERLAEADSDEETDEDGRDGSRTEGDQTQGKPRALLGPGRAQSMIIPKQDGAKWTRFQKEVAERGLQLDVLWCPSHLRDPKPPAVAGNKMDDARQQAG